MDESQGQIWAVGCLGVPAALPGLLRWGFLVDVYFRLAWVSPLARLVVVHMYRFSVHDEVGLCFLLGFLRKLTRSLRLSRRLRCFSLRICTPLLDFLAGQLWKEPREHGEMR